MPQDKGSQVEEPPGGPAGHRVYFLLPLPEPISLPEDVPFSFAGEPTNDEIMAVLDANPMMGFADAAASLPAPESSLIHHRVSVPVTLDAALQALAATVLPWGYANASDQQLPLSPREVSVIEAAVHVGGPEPGEDELRAALTYAIDCAQTMQRAHHLATGAATPLVTPELLPTDVLSGIAEVRAGALPGPGTTLVVTNDRSRELHRPRSMATIDDLEPAWAALSDEHILLRFMDLEREAQWSLQGRGHAWSSLLSVAAGSEYLLNTLIQMLMWEEGQTPCEAASSFAPNRGITARVTGDITGRIGGDWSATGRGPVGSWSRNIAELRNRVMHLGAQVSHEQADQALRSQRDLLAHIVNRLTVPDCLARYPRTALTFAGETILRQRNRWSRRVRAIAEDVSFSDRFQRWRETLLFHLAQCPREPDPNMPLRLLAVFDMHGAVRWVLAERKSWLASPAVLRANALTEQQTEVIRDFQRATSLLAETDPPGYFSVYVQGDSLADPIGEWVDQNWLLPMNESTALGDDLERGFQDIPPDPDFPLPASSSL